MAERRYAQSGKASDGSRRVGREFREYTRIREPKRFVGFALIWRLSSLVSVDFADTADFKEKHKVPHSYSPAEENARFAIGVRDDEIKKRSRFNSPEIAPNAVANCLRCFP